ncbi:flagellar hook-length control protein FliK [Sulfurimonas sp.]|uniref:flagellar hook-length control protein FliK n=1 Tax=Sulfurimonas sp. TaxID=2022749 RepID=UPI002AB2BE1D|nr:flagellar hook-length control protein FliK [Sulfurimonas sp.]
MINISNNKHLDIILPNTNKALKEVLKSASPKELEVLTQSKDLKSVINSLLQESSKNSASDKTILNLVKNNPTLKNLGTISSTIKDLLNSLKSTLQNQTTEKTPLPIEKVLKEFLVDIKQLSESALKTKITNSGIFLESKLKNVQNPQVQLKETLNSLLKSIEKSSIYPVKVLNKHIKEILNSEIIKNATNKSLTTTSPLRENLPNEKQALNKVAKTIEKIIQTMQTNLKSEDITTTKEFSKILEKLQHTISPKVLTPENFKVASIQESIVQLLPQLTKSQVPEAKGLFDALSKILKILPNTSLEQLTQTKIPQEIKSAILPLENAIEKSDTLFSKDTKVLLNKLTTLDTPQKLSSSTNVKEIVVNDLKSVLLKTGEEISKSPLTNQSEVLKHIDKLSLQIDYHQLVSHLSNSSSLYLPFSWDALEEGSLNIKRDEDDRFYCDIELKLKEYGELSLRLVLYEKNQINIKIHSDNIEFQKS